MSCYGAIAAGATLSELIIDRPSSMTPATLSGRDVQLEGASRTDGSPRDIYLDGLASLLGRRAAAETARLAPSIATVGELVSLPDGWDTYGAPAIKPGLGVATICLLSGIIKGSTPLPNVTPTGQGGLQLEWRGDRIGLEIELRPSRQIEILFYDESKRSEIEGSLWDHLEIVRHALAQMGPEQV